jgi:hypothetical protein
VELATGFAELSNSTQLILLDEDGEKRQICLDACMQCICESQVKAVSSSASLLVASDALLLAGSSLAAARDLRLAQSTVSRL